MREFELVLPFGERESSSSSLLELRERESYVLPFGEREREFVLPFGEREREFVLLWREHERVRSSFGERS